MNNCKLFKITLLIFGMITYSTSAPCGIIVINSNNIVLDQNDFLRNDQILTGQNLGSALTLTGTMQINDLDIQRQHPLIRLS